MISTYCGINPLSGGGVGPFFFFPFAGFVGGGTIAEGGGGKRPGGTEAVWLVTLNREAVKFLPKKYERIVVSRAAANFC